MTMDRYLDLDTKRQLEDWLAADIERQWAAMCDALAAAVTASINPEPI